MKSLMRFIAWLLLQLLPFAIYIIWFSEADSQTFLIFLLGHALVYWPLITFLFIKNRIRPKNRWKVFVPVFNTFFIVKSA